MTPRTAPGRAAASRWGRAAVACVTFALASGAASSRAELDRGPRPTAVFVVGDGAPLPSATAETIRVTLEAALRADPSLDLLDVDVALMAKSGASPLDVLETGLAAFDTGRDALARGEPSEAIDSLERAEPLIASVAAYAEPTTLAEVTLELGAALLRAARGADADAAFERMSVLAPALSVEAFAADDGLVEAVRRARRRVERRGRGGLAIDSSPSGALAYVDGRLVGFTPTEASNLAVGTHHVSVRRGGYARATLPVEIGKGQQGRATLTLTPSPRRTAIDDLAKAAGAGVADAVGPPAVRELAIAVGAEHVVLLVVPNITAKAPRYRAYLYEGTTARKLSEADGPADDFDVEAVFAQMGRRLYQRAAATRRDAGSAETRPLHRQWWFWTAVAITAAVAVPIFLYTTRAEAPRCPTGQSCGQLVLDF